MQLDKKIKNIFNIYLSHTLEIRVQFFNLLAFFGIAAGILAALIGALAGSHAAISVTNASAALTFYILLLVAEKRKCYRLCSWLCVISIFMIAFPALFFLCGGHKSGTSCFFILAVAFTALLLEKHEKIIALTLEFLIYSGCTLIAFYRPAIVAVFPSDFIHTLHALLNFLLCGVLMLTIFLMRNRMIYARQGQIEELNRELAARNETLLRYDRMKSEFLATVAHEINTPLAVIAASGSDSLDLLDEWPLKIEEIKQNQATIDRRVKMIDNILLDLMDSVAIENGRLSLNRQPVDMRELLLTICDTQFYKLDVNGNTIAYDFQPDLPNIWADPPRIEQVMINLLANAVKHTHGGVITIGLSAAGSHQIISVRDTGEGMDAETVRVAFKHYVSTKSDFWRHGMGLHISRQIIAAHGGDIWIESEEKRGTAIYFSLSEGVE